MFKAEISSRICGTRKLHANWNAQKGQSSSSDAAA